MALKYIDISHNTLPSSVNQAGTVTAAVTAITKANPGAVTATAHGFTTGDLVTITGAGGMVEVNNQEYTITVVNANSYTIGVDSTAFTTYTSGGTATKRMTVAGQVRLVYDDTKVHDQLVLATIRAKEALIERLAVTG